MKLFNIFKKKEATPVKPALPVEEQLRLKALIEKCDIALIENEFTSENVDVIIEDLTPFQLAIYLGCEVLINHFIELGADVNKTYPDGNSALIIVCGQGNIKLAELLLKKNAALSYVNQNKTSAIWYATTDVNPELVKLLLEHGANPFIDTGNGTSSFDIARIMNLDEIVQIMEGFRS